MSLAGLAVDIEAGHSPEFEIQFQTYDVYEVAIEVKAVIEAETVVAAGLVPVVVLDSE